MSYPQFNLTTLQLPAPTSNMTKAEYKAAYGIDLDKVNIKAFKLVLLGNEKYPIDQIKEVEDGYEIYFNGRIISITDIVQTSDKVYDVANSKPLYFHPITIVNVPQYVVSLIIIDNSSAIIDTPAKLTAKFNEIFQKAGERCRFPTTGSLYIDNTLCPAYNIEVVSAGGFAVYGFDGTQTKSIGLALDTASAVYDGVNKIN